MKEDGTQPLYILYGCRVGETEYLDLVDDTGRKRIVQGKTAFRQHHEGIVEFRFRLLDIHYKGVAHLHPDKRIIDVLRNNLPVRLFIDLVKIYHHPVEKEFHLDGLQFRCRLLQRVVESRKG